MQVGMDAQSTDKLISREPWELLDEELPDKAKVFATGLNFYKLVLLFFIGAFLGDIVETIFCRIDMGMWMSRSSVIWGHFSIVWGLAIVLATILLYRYRHRPSWLIFVAGTVIGGIYEYFSSIFHELVFGRVFWNYSHYPFNLDGRVNLLFCLYWGIAAVVWIKYLYPLFSNLVEKIPRIPGAILTWLLVAFMIVNVSVTCMAWDRYNTRNAGFTATNAVDEWFDMNFDDARMAAIYPTAEDR